MATSYRLNTPGARTLADAAPLKVQGLPVTTEVDADNGWTVFAGTMIIAQGRFAPGTRSFEMKDHFVAVALAWDAGVDADRRAQAGADLAAFEAEITA